MTKKLTLNEKIAKILPRVLAIEASALFSGSDAQYASLLHNREVVSTAGNGNTALKNAYDRLAALVPQFEGNEQFKQYRSNIKRYGAPVVRGKPVRRNKDAIESDIAQFNAAAILAEKLGDLDARDAARESESRARGELSLSRELSPIDVPIVSENGVEVFNNWTYNAIASKLEHEALNADQTIWNLLNTRCNNAIPTDYNWSEKYHAALNAYLALDKVDQKRHKRPSPRDFKSIYFGIPRDLLVQSLTKRKKLKDESLIERKAKLLKFIGQLDAVYQAHRLSLPYRHERLVGSADQKIDRFKERINKYEAIFEVKKLKSALEREARNAEKAALDANGFLTMSDYALDKEINDEDFTDDKDWKGYDLELN